MTTSLKKEKRKIQFELTPLGLFGVGVVCFFLFAWMFFLGVWAGQTVLLPSQPSSLVSFNGFPSGLSEKQMEALEKRSAIETEQDIEVSATGAQENIADAVESSFFSLQVGAFSSEARARGAASSWIAKGYKAFYQAPSEDGDIYWRAFVGKYSELPDANDAAEKFNDKEQVKSFIALVPAASMRKP